jgi:thioredoxin reductase (NADPH)
VPAADPVVVVGAGVAGLATAIWCRRLDLEVVVLERADAPGGQLRELEGAIEDYPPLPPLRGRDLADRFAGRARELGVEVRTRTEVVELDVDARTVRTTAGALAFGDLVLAVGARPRCLGVAGEEEALETDGHVSSADPSPLHGKRVAIVGGGDRALEEAVIFAEAGARVFVVHRSEMFRGRRDFLARARAHERVTLRPATTVEGFHRDGRGIVVSLARYGGRSTLEVDVALVRIGNRPQTSPFAESVATADDGRILATSAGATSAAGVWAVGDATVDERWSSVAVAAASGMICAKAIVLGRPADPFPRRNARAGGGRYGRRRAHVVQATERG